MRIGIVTTWFERGAAYVSRQFKDALEPEHDVFIFARGGEQYARNDPNWDGPFVTWAKPSRNPKVTTFQLGDFRRWIETNQLDVVFFNEQHWWKPVALCAQLGIKTGTYVDYYTEKTVPIFGLYDFLICCTERHHSAFDWHPQAFYVPWGTDIDLFKPSSFDLVEEDQLTFFHSCGWDPIRKSTEMVLRVFRSLKGPCRLIVHTQVPVPGDFEELHNVEFIHDTVPAPGLFCRGDVYVYPSKIDGIGLTLAEALSSGLALVTTDHAPMNEFLTPNVGRGVGISRLYSRHDGYYWPMCNVDENHLRQVMQDLVDHRQTVPDLKRAARAYAEEFRDWKKNAAALSSIFEGASHRDDSWKAMAIELARTQDTLWGTPIGDIISQFPVLMKPLQAIVRFREWARRRKVI